MELLSKSCSQCNGSTRALSADEQIAYIQELSGWKVLEDHHLEKQFSFPDFKTTLDFVNRVGAVAEEQNHHPNINFTWGAATITIYTHSIDGLSENDFILAAHIDTLK